jgi:hypothetical protein
MNTFPRLKTEWIFFVLGLLLACSSEDNTIEKQDYPDAGEAQSDAGGTSEAGSPDAGEAQSDAGGASEAGSPDAGEAQSDAGGASEAGSPDAGEAQSDAGGASEAGCTREALRALVDDYFEALAAHDVTRLPLAADVKFTENAERIEPGEGLWQKAEAIRFKRSALDTERCGTHTEAVLDEAGEPIIFGVRLQLVDDEITEIETYIVRKGTYIAAGVLELFSPEGVIESDTIDVTDVRWEALVPEDQRSTREELNAIADSYFESFGPAGHIAPMKNDCYRWEDGVRTTDGDCSAWLPADGQGRGGMITHRRYPIADTEAGIAIGYVLFRDAIDFHMFKIIDGEIRLIEAVITGYGYESTGWEEQEESI